MRGMIFCVAILAAACGDGRVTGDSGTPRSDGGSTGELTVEQLCEEVARIGCDANQRCCTDPARMPASVDACLSLIRPRCVASGDSEAFRAGRIRLDLAAAAEYLDTYRAAASACVGVSVYDLSNVLEGTLGEGGDCSVTEDDYSNAQSCMDGLGCAIDYSTNAGTCRPLGGLRSPCSSGEPPCGPGLFCDYDGTTPVCAILRDDGESCTSDQQCWSYYCDTTCQPRPGDPYYCL